MSRAPRVVRVGSVVTTALILGVWPSLAAALTATTLSVTNSPDVFITELQTTSTTASEEFIEIYNNTDHDVDFADLANGGKDLWKLQFFSSTSTASGAPDWTKPSATVSLGGVIAAHDYFLLSSAQVQNAVTTVYKPGGIDPDQTYTARLSDTGGGLQLVDATSSVVTAHDRVVWQKPTDGQLLPDGVLATPTASGSLQRLPNEDGQYVQEDGSLAAFAPETQLSPKDAWAAPEVVQDPAQSNADDTSASGNPADGTATDSQDTGTPPATPADRAAQAEPVITELLPNPAAPQNDTDNEYVELYNPNTTTFDLTGYTLEAGTSTLHDFTFSEGASLPPQSYTAFFSSLTKVALANGGSQVRLLSADNEVVSESAAYTTASEGQAWAWDGSTWSWTTTPTPGAGNVFTVPLVAGSSKTAAPPVAAKSKAKVMGVSTTKKPAKKPSTKTTKKPAKKLAASAGTSQPGVAPDASQTTPIHPWTLAAIGVAAILYGVYEYRVDIQNYFHQRASNRAARRAARAEA
ncbi:MAG TPA: lamin tail domain-containing protein [Candidatus Saccharimonadales bacterium]|nr:lamin tail domain-containing protein [Candidatus Saccharimonadales bacterium]